MVYKPTYIWGALSCMAFPYLRYLFIDEDEETNHTTSHHKIFMIFLCQLDIDPAISYFRLWKMSFH